MTDGVSDNGDTWRWTEEEEELEWMEVDDDDEGGSGDDEDRTRRGAAGILLTVKIIFDKQTQLAAIVEGKYCRNWIEWRLR